MGLYEINDEGFIYRSMVSGFVHKIDVPSYKDFGHRLMIGDKLCAGDPYSEEDCLELEKELCKAGFKTRVAQHGETKEWSVAIIGEEK